MDQGDWVERYATAWKRHAEADADALNDLLSMMHIDVRYEDVPTTSVFFGHDGVREMGASAHTMSSDLKFTVVSSLFDGAGFALEHEARGTNTGPLGEMPATGKTFLLRGVSIGEVSGEGLVTSHRDYWDLASFLTQVGLLPAAS